MKVAISVFDEISKDNGTTVRAKRIFEILSKYFNVIIVTCTHIYHEKIDSSLQRVIVKIPKTRQLAQLPFWFAGLFLTSTKRRFDLIYCSNDWYGFILYYFFSKVYHYQIVFEAHGILSEEYKEIGRSSLVVQFARIWERFAITRSNTIIALSKRILDFYARYNKNIHLIPVFLDTERYRVNVKKRHELREKYGLSKNKVVGLIGPFDSVWNKYSLEFINRNLNKFDNRIKFLVIGAGCTVKKENEKMVYAGYVGDYAGTLSCLDAVLVPANASTSGPLNKIIEAMASSIPVFTTLEGAVGLDYAENGRNIFIFDENELVEKVNTLIFDENLLIKVGAKARETIDRNYSRKIKEKKLIRVLHGVSSHS